MGCTHSTPDLTSEFHTGGDLLNIGVTAAYSRSLDTRSCLTSLDRLFTCQIRGSVRASIAQKAAMIKATNFSQPSKLYVALAFWVHSVKFKFAPRDTKLTHGVQL